MHAKLENNNNNLQQQQYFIDGGIRKGYFIKMIHKYVYIILHHSKEKENISYKLFPLNFSFK